MEKLEIFKGEQLKFTAPSGVLVTIREQSAEDDAILSNMTASSVKDMMINSINRFVASIVTENGYNNQKYLTVGDVESMKMKDKHYILLKSRIHSIGKDLDFEYECTNKRCGHKTDISVDLSKQYDADLSLPLKDQETTPYTIQPYPKGNDTHFEATLSSGAKVRMEYFTGRGELFVLQAYENKILSSNSELIARNISYWAGNEWVALKSLNVFSKRESIQLRQIVKDNDSQFEAGVPVTCPKCEAENFLPFITIPDFFFPAGTSI